MNNVPLRVAMLINGYHPRVGGAERQVGALAPLLQSQRVHVQILTRRYPGLSPFEVVDGIPVHRLAVPGAKPIASLSFTLHGLSLLKKLQPDVIHAHDMFSCTTTAVAMKQMSGLPLVVTVHGGGAAGDVGRLHEKAFGSQRMAIFRRYVDRFITISEEIDEALASIGIPEERRVAIPNGVDTKRFSPLAQKEDAFAFASMAFGIEEEPFFPMLDEDPSSSKRALRQSLGLPTEGLIMVFTGRLVPGKRVDQLVGVWPAVRAEHRDATLLILGIGPEEEALKQMAGAGVHFAGRVENVVPYLQASDLFALPSIAEGLSVALLEAMSTELAVISTDVGGASDVISHKNNGWLIPPDDPPALQEAILELMDNQGLRLEMARQGRETVVENYSLSVVTTKLRKLYEELAR